MPEPITLVAVGSVALAEGIKFLYNQAGEVLRRRRERRDAVSKETPEQAVPASTESPPILEGQLSSPVIDFDAVERMENDLRQLRGALADYAEEIETTDSSNRSLVEATDALRRLLEAIYHQRITFKGEERPSSGPVVEGEIDVGEVAGYAAAVRARVITSGRITGRAEVDRVAPEGQVIGVEVDKIGDDPS